MKKIFNKEKVLLAFTSAMFVLGTEFVFVSLFGVENLTVGYLMSIAAISLLNKDFTLKITSKTIELLILNLILGLASYFVTTNIYLGLFINIIVIFLVNYTYMTELTSPTSYIFLMNYILMWGKKIPISGLLNRLLALSLGVFIIMIFQIIFNKKAFRKKTKILTIKLIEDITKEIDALISRNPFDNIELEINNEVRSLYTIINGTNYKMFYYSLEEKIILNIVIALERIDLILFNSKNIDKLFLQDFKVELQQIKSALDDRKKIETTIHSLEAFIYKYKETKNSDIKQLIEVSLIIKLTIESLHKLKKRELKKINKDFKRPLEFKIRGKFKREFKIDSLIFNYSAKLSTVIALAMFISDKLALPYGKWLVLTIYVIMQPYVEDTVIKSKKRVKGTIFGVLLFFSIFTMFGETISKPIVLFIALFLYFYYPAKDYDKKVIMLTIISLTSLTGVASITKLSIDRLIYILAGVAVVYIINKYVFPYTINKSIIDLKNKYNRLLEYIGIELNEIVKGKKQQEKLIRLILLCNDVENKLIMNNSRINNEELNDFIKEKNKLMREIRFLLLESYYINKGNVN